MCGAQLTLQHLYGVCVPQIEFTVVRKGPSPPSFPSFSFPFFSPSVPSPSHFAPSFLSMIISLVTTDKSFNVFD